MQAAEIHGAGVAGLLTALAIADRFAVTLVAPRACRPTNGLEIVDDEFVDALTELGLSQLWQGLAGTRPVSGIRTAWPGEGGPAWAAGLRLGNNRYAIDRQALEQALSALVDTRPEIRRPAIDAKVGSAFVIDATGRASALARRVGVASRSVARLVAHVGIGSWRMPSDPIIEPCATGWWYVSGGPARATAILFTDGRLDGGDAEWERILTTAPLVSNHFIRDPEARVRSVSASSGYLERSCGTNWAAVGDAALSRDPLSSGGLGAAARSALRLRACLTAVGFDAAAFARQAELEVARYRIARHRYYRTAADQLGGSFWASQARLAT